MYEQCFVLVAFSNLSTVSVKVSFSRCILIATEPSLIHSFKKPSIPEFLCTGTAFIPFIKVAQSSSKFWYAFFPFFNKSDSVLTALLMHYITCNDRYYLIPFQLFALVFSFVIPFYISIYIIQSFVPTIHYFPPKL